MALIAKNFSEASEKREDHTSKKADRAMPKTTSTGAPARERRIPSRDFGYEGARTIFRR